MSNNYIIIELHLCIFLILRVSLQDSRILMQPLLECVRLDLHHAWQGVHNMDLQDLVVDPVVV